MKYFHHRHLETYRVSRTTWKQGLYRKLIHRKTHLQHTTNKLDLVFEVKHANRWLQTKEEVRGLKWSEPPPWTLMRFLLQCRSHISSQLKGCLLSIKMRTRTTHKWTNTIHKARRLCVTETLQRGYGFHFLLVTDLTDVKWKPLSLWTQMVSLAVCQHQTSIFHRYCRDVLNETQLRQQCCWELKVQSEPSQWIIISAQNPK